MGAKQTVVSKAMKDAAFRKRLLQDPKGTLESEFGIELPAGMKVQVHEESQNTIHLVLPGPVEMSAQRALSDDELQSVAGGVVPRMQLDPVVNPLINPLSPSPVGLMPSPGGKIAAGDTFGAYTGCCSTARRLF